jgi:glycosyltransferase involved in cell wall biosynthesis
VSVRTSRPRHFIDVFNRYASFGGEEDSVQRIVSSLQRAGHVVSRFLRESDEWLRPGAPARWRQPFLMMQNPGVLAELQALHERERPDAWILHNIIPVVSLGIYGLARELNVPIIQWLHNYRPLSPSGTLRAGETTLDAADPLAPLKEAWAGSWRGSRALTAWLALGQWMSRRRGDLDGVSAWIAISDAMRGPFERAGIPASRLHTLRHFYRFGPFDPSAGDGGYFLFLGRIVREKGVRELVDLWSAPELRHVQLVIAGEGPLLEESKSRASPNVRFAGFVRGAEKLRLLSACRGVIVTSVWDEPLGLVVYEAYEHGKPVLSNPAGGLRELIVDGETGRLIPLSDRRAWVDAILALDSDRGARCTMGREGRRWLERNASEEGWHERFDAILREVLDR